MGSQEANIAQLTHARDSLAITLASIGDGVITTDAQGHVTFLNAEAERLTGWTSNEGAGQQLSVVFRALDERTRQPAEDLVEKVVRTGKVIGLANHTVLLSKH